jgi:PEP-CTERM motif
MLRKLAIAVAAVAAVGSAQATTYDWGLHDPIELTLLGGPASGGLVMGSGVFTDFYNFAIAVQSTVSSTLVSTAQPPLFGILDGTYGLISAGDDNTLDTVDDFMIQGAMYGYSGSTGDVVNSIVLNPGVYRYGVTGNVLGMGGIYLLTSTVTPVPEPETISLMLAGVGLLGFMAKRRKAS